MARKLIFASFWGKEVSSKLTEQHWEKSVEPVVYPNSHTSKALLGSGRTYNTAAYNPRLL